MEYGTIPGVDKPVSRLVHGTIMLKEDELEEGFALLDAVYDAGCRTWDCAPVYGGGQCERVLGAWSDARGYRDEIVLLTKGCHHNKDRKRVTPFDISADTHEEMGEFVEDFMIEPSFEGDDQRWQVLML